MEGSDHTDGSSRAQLLPSDFDLAQLPHSERRVIESFLGMLDDSWIVIPKVPIVVDGRDSEIDIVLVNFDHGALLVEVKGGIVTMQDGTWKSYDKVIADPADQVTGAKHALIKRLKKSKTPISRIFLQHIVAFPDIVDFPATGGGPHCPREIVFTGTELRNPIPHLMALRTDRDGPTQDELAAFIKALRPDIAEVQVDGRHVRGTTTRITSASFDRLGPVIGLDENVRVYLRGSAGTGKTFIASRWAKRALERHESVLYLCFNALLARDMSTRLTTMASHIVDAPPMMAGTFHSVARQLLGENAPPIPDGGTAEEIQSYWYDTLPGILGEALPGIPARFDTIILDEAQDFRPRWLQLVEQLMVDRDNGRFYMMADTRQAIYVSDWRPPSGITTLELTQNIRNSRRIGRVVQRLGGAELSRQAVVGPDVQFHPVSGLKECVKAVRRSLQYAMDELAIPPSQILVVTSHTELRDYLCSEVNGDTTLTRWDSRTEDTVACETIHRTKGLERPGVIFVDMDEEPDPTLAYIATSRASAFLAVVGRQALMALVGGPDR